MTTKLSRQDLYSQVWERPVTKVAADLGISAVALHKICRKHRVPVPPRGYWAKVAAGRPVIAAKLPTVKDPRLEEIGIIGAPTSWLDPEVLKAARVKSLGAAGRSAGLVGDPDTHNDPRLDE